MKRTSKKAAVKAPKFLLFRSSSDGNWYIPLVDRMGQTVWPSLPYPTKRKARASVPTLIRIIRTIGVRSGPKIEEIDG